MSTSLAEAPGVVTSANRAPLLAEQAAILLRGLGNTGVGSEVFDGNDPLSQALARVRQVVNPNSNNQDPIGDGQDPNKDGEQPLISSFNSAV